MPIVRLAQTETPVLIVELNLLKKANALKHVDQDIIKMKLLTHAILVIRKLTIA